jgi:hypothetical protein
MDLNNKDSKLWEYRVKYNATKENVALNNFHYYMAHNAEEALSYHYHPSKHKSFSNLVLSVERHNPYSDQWEDETHLISNAGWKEV